MGTFHIRAGGTKVTKAGRSHGIELWTNTAIPYATKGRTKLYLRPEHLSVCFASPTLLRVAVRAPALKVNLLVGHAPHSGHPRETVAAWWDQLVEQSRLAGSAPEVWMLDANAAVGTPTSEAIGDHDAVPESFAGECFHEKLLERAMCLPATFDHIHRGPSHTWFSKNSRAAT